MADLYVCKFIELIMLSGENYVSYTKNLIQFPFSQLRFMYLRRTSHFSLCSPAFGFWMVCFLLSWMKTKVLIFLHACFTWNNSLLQCISKWKIRLNIIVGFTDVWSLNGGCGPFKAWLTEDLMPSSALWQGPDSVLLEQSALGIFQFPAVWASPLVADNVVALF